MSERECDRAAARIAPAATNAYRRTYEKRSNSVGVGALDNPKMNVHRHTMRLLFIVTGRRGAVPYNKQISTAAQTATAQKRNNGTVKTVSQQTLTAFKRRSRPFSHGKGLKNEYIISAPAYGIA